MSSRREDLQRKITSIDPVYLETLELAAKAAPTSSSIMIAGPTGSGKRRLAAAIHELSGVAGSMVTVNCAAMAPDLFEAELFGYEKGAYTGATERKPGLVELAEHGTLYLAGVQNLPTDLQPKLLRFAEDGSFRRIGGIAELKVVCRLISSIDDASSDGGLREDLRYRLEVIRLRIPPLSERMEDVPLLAEELVRQEAGDNVELSAGALGRLAAHSWPGNVRELRNVLQSALIAGDGDRIDVDHVAVGIDQGHLVKEAARREISLAELEKTYIALIIEKTGRNYSRAAEILGINRKTLLEKRRKYGLG